MGWVTVMGDLFSYSLHLRSLANPWQATKVLTTPKTPTREWEWDLHKKINANSSVALVETVPVQDRGSLRARVIHQLLW
jgi:hypothetical protein